jgi:agmatinase
MSPAARPPLDAVPTDDAVFGSGQGGSREPTWGGTPSFMRRRIARDLDGVDLVVLGIPFDAAVTNRPGARFGPAAIRRASAILDGDPQYPFGFDPFEILTVVDGGDVGWDHARPWLTHDLIHARASAILAAGAKLFSLGGDHSVTLPLLVAHAERHGPLALVQFDAHQDTWGADGEGGPGLWIDHGGFVRRAVELGAIDPARSIQVGIRSHAPRTCGLDVVTADEIELHGIGRAFERIRDRVGDRPTYLSFDIDALDPAFAPGTGTPVAGGLTTREALVILRALGSLDLVGGDVVEVAPAYDSAEVTAIAAAAVARHFVCLEADRRRRRAGGSG